MMLLDLQLMGLGQTACTNLNVSQRKQPVKVGSTFNEWQEIVLEVPQGSILGPIFFNIFVNNFNFAMESSCVCSFADNDTGCAYDKDVESVATRLEDKQHQKFPLKIENKLIDVTREFERSVKLLGINVDDELKFDKPST